ncbi:hypothetical protein J6497_39820 [Bradyrhizobium sp. CNPSo 4026]|nr:hypothetical protein [Bradyrhizobium cenepequi]
MVAISLVFTPAVVLAQSPMVAISPLAPNTPESVHVQPRGRAFAPNSAEDDVVQKQISRFNATQQLMDAKLDRRIIICRRC